jgi:hypothetical protein
MLLIRRVLSYLSLGVTMSGKIELQRDAVIQYFFGFRACAVYLAAVLMAIPGCAERKQEQASKPSISEPQITPTPPLATSPTPEMRKSPLASDKSEREEVQETAEPLPGSGQAAWAQGFEGQLIRGLDGELYPPYSATTIRHVQSVMKNRGLYAGPLNGVLDAPTMESIYTFQEATYDLLRCGVPTPRTRKLLEQGSHTDIASLDRNRVGGSSGG